MVPLLLVELLLVELLLVVPLLVVPLLVVPLLVVPLLVVPLLVVPLLVVPLLVVPLLVVPLLVVPLLLVELVVPLLLGIPPLVVPLPLVEVSLLVDVAIPLLASVVLPPPPPQPARINAFISIANFRPFLIILCPDTTHLPSSRIIWQSRATMADFHWSSRHQLDHPIAAVVVPQREGELAAADAGDLRAGEHVDRFRRALALQRHGDR